MSAAQAALFVEVPRDVPREARSALQRGVALKDLPDELLFALTGPLDPHTTIEVMIAEARGRS